MALDWINNSWARGEKETFEWLDTIDLTEFIHDYYGDVENIINDIYDRYQEKAEQYLTKITNEEFVEYLRDRYNDSICCQEEIITTYWIRREELL